MSNPNYHTDQWGVQFTEDSDGELHNLSHAAAIYPDGWFDYFIHGQHLTYIDWESHPLRIEYVIKENIKLILNE